ncbi:3763_t:CDS:2, partial [Acaulospora colombiana]
MRYQEFTKALNALDVRGRWFKAIAKTKKISDTTQTNARNLTLSIVIPPGKNDGSTDLTVSSRKGHPSRTCPPSNDESKEPGVFGTRTFSCPDIDRSTEWESRANFRKHSGRSWTTSPMDRRQRDRGRKWSLKR